MTARRSTKLLVSVRDVAEARTALDVGVDLLDLKEPSRGPLGAVDAATVAEVVEFVAGRVPVSLALGELLELPTPVDPSLAVSRQLTYLKVGLAGCASQPDWLPRWRALLDVQPSTVAPVAVVYADAASVHAPGTDEVIEAAASVGCRTVLVDTATKDGRGLLDHWPAAVLRSFIADVQRRAWTCVVGGSLTTATIPAVADCGPDYIAVRGAACRDSRRGPLDAARLRDVRAALS
jgi:uncharacterized protein (UPF0264 family)